MATTTEQTEQGDVMARRVVQATIAELRGHNAQLVRQQELLLRERDDLVRRLDEERVRYEATVAQWRQRGEESLAAQLELAARLNAALQRIEEASSEVARLNAALQQRIEEASSKAEAPAEVARLRDTLAAKDAQIVRLESLVRDNATQTRNTLTAKNAHIVRLESLVQDNATRTEETFAAKNAHITHLESLLAGSPKSLVGAWMAMRRQRHHGEAERSQLTPHASA